MVTPFPALRRGQTIGLLGGSFDPPHQGHVHITREALRRFGLDRVWWLLSPGNPLKAHGPAPLDERMAAARRIMQHPKVEVSDYEARAGTRYTAETLDALRRDYRGVKFVCRDRADRHSCPAGRPHPGAQLQGRAGLCRRPYPWPGVAQAGRSRGPGVVFRQCSDARRKLQRDPRHGPMAQRREAVTAGAGQRHGQAGCGCPVHDDVSAICERTVIMPASVANARLSVIQG